MSNSDSDDIVYPVVTSADSTNNDTLLANALREGDLPRIKLWMGKYGPLWLTREKIDEMRRDGEKWKEEVSKCRPNVDWAAIGPDPWTRYNDAKAFYRYFSPSYDTVVTEVCRNGHLELLRYLDSIGAPLDDHDDDVQYPIDIAAFEGYFDIVKYLVERGVNFRSSLVAAARGGHQNIVEFILQHGADLNEEGHWWGFHTPIEAAILSKDDDTVQFLRAAGAVEPEQSDSESEDEYEQETAAALEARFKCLRDLYEVDRVG